MSLIALAEYQEPLRANCCARLEAEERAYVDTALRPRARLNAHMYRDLAQQQRYRAQLTNTLAELALDPQLQETHTSDAHMLWLSAELLEHLATTDELTATVKTSDESVMHR